MDGAPNGAIDARAPCWQDHCPPSGRRRPHFQEFQMATEKNRFLRGDDIPRSEITPRDVFENRRRLIQLAGAAGASALVGAAGLARAQSVSPDPKAQKLSARPNPAFRVPDTVTPYQ